MQQLLKDIIAHLTHKYRNVRPNPAVSDHHKCNGIVRLWQKIGTAGKAWQSRPIFRAAKEFIFGDRWGRDVPALTYSTLMTLTPFVALMFVIARTLGFDLMMEAWIKDVLSAQPVAAEYIVGFVNNYLKHTRSQYIVGVSSVIMLWSIFSLMRMIERTFNDIWKTEDRSILHSFVFNSAVFILFVTMIIISSVLSISLPGVAHKLGIWEYIPDIQPLLLFSLKVAFLFVFFVFIYKIIPNTKVEVRHTILPSLIASIGFALLQYLYFSVQVWLVSYNVIYGSLAALPLFLLWLQMSWGICVFGIVLCHSK